MYIRKSSEEDFESMVRIYARARRFMAENGNPNQWGPTRWPPEALLKQDIRAGKSYVCANDSGEILGTFFYDYGVDIEPSYRITEGGAWRDESAFGVIHRLASAGTEKGVGAFCLDWAFRQCGHLKIDTHPDNAVMRFLLKKCGFTERCIIHVPEDDDPRIAFEK